MHTSQWQWNKLFSRFCTGFHAFPYIIFLTFLSLGSVVRQMMLGIAQFSVSSGLSRTCEMPDLSEAHSDIVVLRPDTVPVILLGVATVKADIKTVFTGFSPAIFSFMLHYLVSSLLGISSFSFILFSHFLSFFLSLFLSCCDLYVFVATWGINNAKSKVQASSSLSLLHKMFGVSQVEFKKLCLRSCAEEAVLKKLLKFSQKEIMLFVMKSLSSPLEGARPRAEAGATTSSVSCQSILCFCLAEQEVPRVQFLTLPPFKRLNSETF